MTELIPLEKVLGGEGAFGTAGVAEKSKDVDTGFVVWPKDPNGVATGRPFVGLNGGFVLM